MGDIRYDPAAQQPMRLPVLSDSLVLRTTLGVLVAIVFAVGGAAYGVRGYIEGVRADGESLKRSNESLKESIKVNSDALTQNTEAVNNRFDLSERRLRAVEDAILVLTTEIQDGSGDRIPGRHR